MIDTPYLYYLRLFETACTEQCIGVGFCTSETFVFAHRIFASAHLNQLLEACRSLCIKDTALLEELKSVAVEHLGPQVGIITDCIATTEHVCKVCAAVTVLNLGDKAKLGAYGVFKLVTVEVGVVLLCVHTQVEESCRYKLACLESEVEV